MPTAQRNHRSLHSWRVALALAALLNGAIPALAQKQTTFPSASLPFSGSELIGIIQGGINKNTTFGEFQGQSILAGALFHRANNTALAATPTTTYPVVVRDGYASAGDSLPLMFTPLTGPCASNGLVNDGGSCVNTTVGGNSWKANFPPDGAPIEAWGADKTGITDSAAAIASAVAWACTNAKPLYASAGTYNLVASAISVTCNVNNFAFYCAGPNTVFSYSGTSNIDSVFFMDPGVGNGMWYAQLCAMTLTGNSHVNYGLHTARVHHLTTPQGPIRGRNVVQSCFYISFSVTSDLSFSCSSNEGVFTTRPVNGLKTDASSGVGGLYNSRIWIVAEGVSGNCIDLATSANNTFFGTGEGCGGNGIKLASDVVRHNFISMDFEANGLDDIVDNGIDNAWRQIVTCTCLGTGDNFLRIGATANGTIIDGGSFETVWVEAGAGTTANIVLHPTTTSSVTFVGANPRVDYNNVLIAYAPVLSCGNAGTLTTASVTGNYSLRGKTAFVAITASITLNNTCATSLNATLPYSGAVGHNAYLMGRNRGVGGKTVAGIVNQGLARVDMFNYDNSYPASDGSIIDVSGPYPIP